MKQIKTSPLYLACLVFLVQCGWFKDSSPITGTMDETETKLSGVVTIEGNSAPGVLIHLHSDTHTGPLARLLAKTLTRPTTLTDTTDDNGAFSFKKIPAGTYYLEVPDHNHYGLFQKVQVDSAVQQTFVAKPLGALLLGPDTLRFFSNDSLWLPQINRLIPASYGLLAQPLRLPAGEFQAFILRNGDLIELSSIPVQIAPALLTLIDPQQSRSVPIADTTQILDSLRTLIEPVSTIPIATEMLQAILQPGAAIGKDAQINFGLNSEGIPVSVSNSNINLGAYTCLAASVYDRNTVMRALYQFVLPDTISSDKLDTAYLQLNITQWVNKDVADASQIVVHKILREWSEGTGTTPGCSQGGTTVNSAEVNGVTAIERSYGLNWGSIGIGLDGIDASIASYAQTAIVSGTTSPIRFNITQLAKEWLEHPESNYGLLLRSSSENELTYRHIPLFVSSDAIGEDNRWPALILKFRK